MRWCGSTAPGCDADGDTGHDSILRPVRTARARPRLSRLLRPSGTLTSGLGAADEAGPDGVARAVVSAGRCAEAEAVAPDAEVRETFAESLEAGAPELAEPLASAKAAVSAAPSARLT